MWFLYFGSDLSLNLIHPTVQLGAIYQTGIVSVVVLCTFKVHVGLLATWSTLCGVGAILSGVLLN